jgi:tetratricopeptide (TPR) repeat protein
MASKEKLQELNDLVGRGDFEQALHLCNELISGGDQIYEVYSERSYSYHQLGRLSEALRDIEEMIGLRPNSASAYIRKSAINLEIGRDLIVVDCASIVIDSGDEYFMSTALFYRAVAYLNLDKKSEAMRDGLRLPDEFEFAVKTKNKGLWKLTRGDILNMAA